MKIYYEEYMYTHALSSYLSFFILIVHPHPVILQVDCSSLLFL